MEKSNFEIPKEPDKKDLLLDSQGRIADPDYAHAIAENVNWARGQKFLRIFPVSKKKLQAAEESAADTIFYSGVEILPENIPSTVLEKLQGKFASLPIKIDHIFYEKKPRENGGTFYSIKGFRRIPYAQVSYNIDVNLDGSFGKESFHDLSGLKGQPNP